MQGKSFSQRIFVMGGSFNPPTLAHLRLMQALLDGLHADIEIRKVLMPSDMISMDMRGNSRNRLVCQLHHLNASLILCSLCRSRKNCTAPEG